MTTLHRWALPLALGLAAGACGAPSEPSDRSEGGQGAGGEAASSADAAAFARSSATFGAAIYREMARAPGNLAMSPASLSTALTMTWGGARGETADELSRALALEPGSAHAAASAQLRAWNAARESYTLRVANRLFAQRGLPFDPRFVALTRDRYGAPLEALDFIGAPEDARGAVNAWVGDQTEERIPEILPSGSINSDTRLVITNAVYFHGRWAAPFDPGHTTDAAFHLSDGATVDVPTMRRTGGYAYRELDGARVLEMPYVGGELSMVLVLPAEGTELASLEEGLDAAQLAAWTEGLSEERVVLALPRFRIEGAPVALKRALRALGVERAFDPERADFSGIAAGVPLFVGDLYHRAFVDVNEAGPAAAAATAVVVQTRRAGPPPVEYRVDRPFLFLLRDRATGALLFIGRVADPRG